MAPALTRDRYCSGVSWMFLPSESLTMWCLVGAGAVGGTEAWRSRDPCCCNCCPCWRGCSCF